MAKLCKVCLDIEGNDRGLTVTTVAADNRKEAIEKAKKPCHCHESERKK